MDVLYERCCGLAIHQRTVVACLVVPGPGGHATKEVRSFGTLTDELLQLADWLTANGVTHVAMESTGVSGKPVWNLLDDQFALLLVNARHVKAVPGRKTDAYEVKALAGGGRARRSGGRRRLCQRATSGQGNRQSRANAAAATFSKSR